MRAIDSNERNTRERKIAERKQLWSDVLGRGGKEAAAAPSNELIEYLQGRILNDSVGGSGTCTCLKY